MRKLFDNTNRGVLFTNDKEGNPNWADYQGNINVEGKEFWLSAWIKESPKGKFFSLSVKPKEKLSQMKPPAQKTLSTDDDVPF